jgi:dipeptidyl aminopeptidase/acylaminoacyl peptidase
VKTWVYLACLSVATPAVAQSFDAARVFGARETVEQASLSPDGTKLAFLTPTAGQGSAVYVVRLDGADPVPARIMNASGDPERLQQCRWATNSRLVCNVYAVSEIEGTTLVVANRIVSFNDDGSKIAVLQHDRGTGHQLGYATFGGSVIDWNPGGDQVLMMRQYVPETSTGSRLGQTMDGIGVDAVDPVTLRTKVVEVANRTAAEYITDGRGTVRIRGLNEERNGYTTGTRNYFFRRKGSRDWNALSTVTRGEGFDPYGVDPTIDIAYGLKRINGRLAAYSLALDGSGTEKLVFAHDSVDVTGFARIGRNGRIIGARYTTDVSAVHYFDPAVGAMIRTLSKALPKLPLIQVIDSSEDENRMLVWAGSDTDPGRFFLFDRAKKGLNEMMLQRPELENVTLATVKHITYPAADGTMVPAYLTLPAGAAAKGLPAIVLPHGGPEARDEWGFDWLSQFYANQGFAVLQPNFRGSAGYGDAWLRKNGFQSWKTAIGDVSDAGRWLVKEGIADPAKLNIVGWSYGGYAALQSAAIYPDLFKRVVAIAPVTDLERLKADAQAFTSANEVERFIGSGPHIREGSPARNVEAIKAPVLLFHGDRDRNVLIGHSTLMQSRLAAANKKSELVTFKGLDHYLEDSNARMQMLRKSAEFLKAP